MKVALVCSYVPSLVPFRGALLREMASRNWEVVVYGPENEAGEIDAVKALGVSFQGYPLQRAGLNPLEDWNSYRSLQKSFHQFRPEVVLSYTAKPMVYGSLAGFAAGVRTISMVTGLGYAFSGNGPKQRLLRTVQSFLYRKAFARNERVIFLNPDDLKEFVTLGLVNEAKTARIDGEGIDLETFGEVTGRRWYDSPLIFVMVARLLREKGLREYLQAAREVRETHSGVRFLLVGGEDSNPGGIPGSEVRRAADEGIVEWIGAVPDVRPILRSAHIFVLPSYREGMPRSTLEALAMGMPVVTTDAAGCRETVVDGLNGFLVKTGDAAALANGIRRMLSLTPNQLAAMGKSSRRLAEEKFDVRKVNETLLAFLKG